MSSLNLNSHINIKHYVNNEMISHTHNNTHIIYINIRSLRNKLHELEHYIQSLSFVPHLIILTETWLFEEEINYFNIENYKQFHCTRSTRGGGCAIYAHDTYFESNMIFSKDWEGNNILGIHIHNKNFNCNIFAIYKTPHSNTQNFIQEIEFILTQYSNSIIIGDTNINLLNINTYSTVDEYVDIINSNRNLFLNKIESTHATRISNTVSTVIDHIITDIINLPYTLNIQDTHLSDHRLMHLSIAQLCTRKPAINKFITVIDYNKINTSSFFNTNNSPNIESFIENIQNIITPLTKSLPTNTILKNRKPWLSLNVIDIFKKRDFYYKLKQKYPLNEYFVKQFKHFRNKAHFECKQSKQKHYSNLFELNINNNKKFWALTNEIIFNKKPNLNQISTIKHNSSIITNPLLIANTFNDFFTNCIPTRVQNNTTNLPHNNNMLLQNFYLHKTTSKEVISIINKLNISAANGYDNISIQFFKNYNVFFIDRLVLLLNDCITRGIFPNCFKIAKITPVYKSKDKLECTNYRPISVLPSCSKIFERIIQVRLEKFLLENKIINKNQFGFVTNSSTFAACAQLFNFIDIQIDKRQVVGAVFIDLYKAFDSVQHALLIEKLKNIGFTNKELNLIKSYHSDRKQFVQIGLKVQWLTSILE